MLGTITLTVGQQEPSNVILNEGSCENVEVVTDDKTSKDNVGEVGDEGPEAAVSEPVSGDKDDLPEQVTEDQSNEVGFKKVFKFVGFKFTVKKEKTEKSEPVQLLTVKKDEVEANGTENTVKQVDNEQKQETEEDSKEISETANEVAKCVETVVETEKEEVGEKPTEKESEVEKEQKKSPESPTNPIVTETSSPFKKFFTQGWAGLRKKTSFRKSKEEDHQEVEKSIQEQQNETKEDASKKEVGLEEAPEVGLELQEEKTIETEEAKAPVDTVETIVVDASKAEEHASDAIQIISEEDIEKVDGCVKSVTEKVDDVKEIATEIASVELKELDKIKPEAEVPEENVVNQINEVISSCSSPVIEPNEIPSVLSSDTEIKITNLVVEDLAQQLSTSSEGTEIEKVQETITTEADLLSSQEKAKLQGSPLRKLFSGSGLRKLSGKKQKGKKDEDTKPEDVTEQAPVSSEPEVPESNEVDSSPSSPDESVEVSPTEKLTEDAPQASEAEGEGATSEGERKKDGITPWASFKKMVTPKKRAKVPSESDKEDDVEKVKSSTLSSTDSAASVENQVETKEGVEEQKLEKSTEENRKKVDSSVSWEALICVGGSKKRGRKTSDSDEEDVHKSLEESKKPEDEADKAKENYSEEPISQEKENLDDSPSPDQGNSPNEVDGVSTWQSFKRLVTPRRKSKTRIEDKADEPAGVSSVEQSTSDGEAGKDESWVSLKKLIPGRKKKKSDGKLEQAPSNDAGEVVHKSEVADEDYDVPAVVPLSEFDAAEQEKIDAQKSVEICTNYLTEPEIAPEISSEELIHAVTVTVIEGERAVTSLDERSPSWISATVTEQTKELQTKERIESEVIVEEALILSTVSQVIVEAKNLTREAELTSEALTALEEAIEISGAEETTEMISAVSQLTESSATTEEGTPVPEEDKIHSVEEQKKHIKHILYAATESAKLSVDAIVDNVTYAIVNLSQNQESEVEETDDSKTSLQKSAFVFEKVENIEVKDKPDQLPESAIEETEVDSSEKDSLDFEIISTSECMPSVQEEIHKDENVENVKQIVDASAKQVITILAVESADVEKTEKTTAIILTKEQMEDTVITKENIEKETIPLFSEEYKEKMEVADEGKALEEEQAKEFVSVLIKNHIVEESGLVYVEEQVIEESSPLLAKEQTKEERPLILADEEVKGFPFSEEHTKEKSIPILSEEKAKEETTYVLAVEKVQEESAPTVETSSKEKSEPVLAEKTKEKISHAVSEGEDKDVSVTALTVSYYKEENAYASTMVEMENERFKALPQEQLEHFSVLEEDKSIDEKAWLQADGSIPLAQAEDERVSVLEEDLSKDGAPCLAKEQMEETISVAQEKQTEDKSVPTLVQEQVKEENISFLKEDLVKGDSSSPLVEEQVDENIPVMQEEQTKDESVPSLIQEQMEGVSFLKEDLTKDKNASILTNEQVEENISLVQGEQAKEETVPPFAKEQVEERVSALEEQVEETISETQEELAEDESASSLVREQIGESIPVAQAEQTKEKSVLSLTKELEEEIVSVLEKQVEESITVAKKELVEGASSLAKEQIESIPVVEEQVKEESIPALAKVQLDYKNVSVLEEQIEESITVTQEEQADGESASTLAKEQIEGIAAVEEHIKVESVPALAKVQLEDEIVSVLEEQIEESITVAQEELTGESASTLAKEQIEEGIAAVEEHIKVKSVPALAKVQLEDEIVSVLEEQIEESITVAQEELTGESASTLAKEQIEEGIAAVEEHIKVESVPALAKVQLEDEIVSVLEEQIEESITVAQEELTDGESALSLTKEMEESIPDIQATDQSLPAFVNDQVVEESIPLFKEEQAKDENSSSLAEQVEEESIPGVEKQTKDKSDPALAKEHLEEESIPLVQEEQSKYESVPSLVEQVEKESIPEADVQQAKDGVPSLTKEQEEGVAEIGEDMKKDKIATCLNNEGVEESGVAPNEQAKDESAQDLAEKQAAEGSDLIVQQTNSAAIFMEKNAEYVTVENEKPDTEVSPEKSPKESAYAEDVAHLSSVKNYEGAPSSAAEVLSVLDTEIQESVLESSRVLIEESCPEDASEIPTEVHDAGALLPKELKDQEKESSLVDQSLGDGAYIQDSVTIISNITPSETHECVTESSKEIEEPEIIRDVTVEHSTSFHLSLVKDLTETCNDAVSTENIAEIKSSEAKGPSEPVTAAAVEESILEETTKPIVSQTESLLLIQTGGDLANSEGLKVTSEYVKSGVKAVSQTAASIVDAAIDAATSCVAMSTIPKETEESWVDKNEVVTLENMETEREEHNGSQTDLESHSTKIVQKIIKTSLESLSQSLPVELVSEIHEIASAPEVSTKETITVEVTQVFQQTLLEQVILEHSSILEIEQITKEPCCEPIEIVSTSKLTNGNAEELAQGEHISNVCVKMEEVMPKEISQCVNVDEQVKLNVQILEAESETTLVTRSEEKIEVTTVKDSSEEHTPKTTNTVES
ncbi:A-kinase anchor protein 12 isoform X2 [Bombina bombina]|uniref:A-kinase anchor protein 12 isoform X2 n=1 Tax=Bombina bombina TaxID=8345 RepID=UPI00235AA2BE|nr:A-kinase anchor protein 12 isoform X2 [Bombina bombina]